MWNSINIWKCCSIITLALPKEYFVELLRSFYSGKKWNVLRERVDSITYEADQLILGTIIFTILLFLLPTTSMYYMVFTATRSVVLLIQTFTQCLVKLISNFPIYDVIMRFQDSSYKSGNNISKLRHLKIQSCKLKKTLINHRLPV